MTKYNEIVENEYITGKFEIKEIITVSNIYPVFLKIQEDMSRGIYLYKDLSKQQRKINEPFIGYIERINNSLIEFIANIYPLYKRSGNPNYQVVEEWGECKIEQIIYNDYKLLFVKSSSELILMNYLPKTNNTCPVKDFLIPYEIPNYNFYIKNISYRGEKYITVNTFKAFMPYAELNNKPANRGLNNDFFNSFQRSINLDHKYMSQHRTIPELEPDNENYTLLEFKFYRFNNIIVISEYCSPFANNSKVQVETIT